MSIWPRKQVFKSRQKSGMPQLISACTEEITENIVAVENDVD